MGYEHGLADVLRQELRACCQHAWLSVRTPRSRRARRPDGPSTSRYPATGSLTYDERCRCRDRERTSSRLDADPNPRPADANEMGRYQTPEENAKARSPRQRIGHGRHRRRDGGGGSIREVQPDVPFRYRPAGPVAWCAAIVYGVPSATMGAAVVPTFGSQVHDPVGGGDDVEVLLDDDHRVAAAMSRSTCRAGSRCPPGRGR